MEQRQLHDAIGSLDDPERANSIQTSSLINTSRTILYYSSARLEMAKKTHTRVSRSLQSRVHSISPQIRRSAPSRSHLLWACGEMHSVSVGERGTCCNLRLSEGSMMKYNTCMRIRERTREARDERAAFYSEREGPRDTGREELQKKLWSFFFSFSKSSHKVIFFEIMT